MNQQELIGLVCMCMLKMYDALIVFELNIFQKKLENSLETKNRIQAFDSIMCGYFCIGFIDFMLKGKSLLEYANLFSSNEYKKNNKVILKYFQQNLNKLKRIVMFAINIENLKKLKYYIFKKKNNIKSFCCLQ